MTTDVVYVNDAVVYEFNGYVAIRWRDDRPPSVYRARAVLVSAMQYTRKPQRMAVMRAALEFGDRYELWDA